AAIAEVKAREKALNRSYYPRLYFQGAQYARGTGITHDGRVGGPASGLGPNTQNWALGASITFPAFDFFSIRALKLLRIVDHWAKGSLTDSCIANSQPRLQSPIRVRAKTHSSRAVRIYRNSSRLEDVSILRRSRWAANARSA